MARLLQGILPIERGEQVLPDTYNRAIRSLELSLNKFDPSQTPSFLASDRDENLFEDGDIIWNLTEKVLQVWIGYRSENISTPKTAGLSATGALGTVQVIASGNITVEIT